MAVFETRVMTVCPVHCRLRIGQRYEEVTCFEIFSY